MQSTSARTGFVTILGRPSSGKSSLVNALCGEKVSIVSPVPQTTRNTIRGIYHDERGQIVFLDTPGLHDSEKKPNLRMRTVALDSTGEADALLYTLDTSRAPGEEERSVAGILAGSALPRIVVLTKCDLSGGPSRALSVFLQDQGLSDLPQVQTGGLAAEGDQRGLKQLLDQVFPVLPEGEPWYPLDYYTDQEPAFRISEIIREQAILRTRQEVPHALYVEVADLEQDEKALRARVFLCVERSSQQGILVGRGGETVTAIRKESERILNGIFPQPVRLQLQVKVRPRWRRDDTILKKLIR